METAKKPLLTHRLVNHILSVIVIILALYILLTPLLPQFGFWFNKHVTKSSSPLVSANTNGDDKNEQIPEQNVLVIPSMNLQQDIQEGPRSGVLNKGVWHRPSTSTPDQVGNSVIVGHRFTYTNPNGEFYHLDKVKEGDKIVIYWEKTKYVYKVDRVFVAKADDTSVEQQSDKHMLTLYTCTPLWSAKDRLVVQASLQEQAP